MDKFILTEDISITDTTEVEYSDLYGDELVGASAIAPVGGSCSCTSCSSKTQ
ncbi:hypothetical protein AAKU55_003545 [Oxalobacteraceae bacterium GrIS 1.11]